MKVELGHCSHTGIKRDHNEDTYGVSNEDKIWLVADGMGGHDHGEVASAMARDSILYFFHNGKSLKDSIIKANQNIIDSSNERGADLPMGTTIVILNVNENKFKVAWVGDSRIYKLTNNKLQAISTDHSYVQELVDQNLISAEQARTHPHRNVVTQALGVTDNSEIRVALSEGGIKSGDKFLLCSDGLTEEVNDEEIEELLQQQLHPQEITDQLIIKALESGGSDNITVIVLEFTD
jgi:protein phosphatase